MTIKYRPEIDGLRTIAVFSVVIYHAQFLINDTVFLKGGFLGVDVFFVISGYLITNIIYKEIMTNENFSYRNFYDRRARRILPQLFFVIIVFFPVAHVFLLPSQYVDFAKSVISIGGFSSNFYWLYSLQEYGAESADLKPLLHTWSLAIEEQYYFIFPIIVLALFKFAKRDSIAVFTLLMLLSLAAADYISGKDPSFSFYTLVTRFWELIVGSILAYAMHLHPPTDNDTLLMKTMPSLGLFLIIHAVIFVDLNSVRHPGYITLFPVVGAVLIIWFSNKDELTTKLLSSKLFVFFGLISYSLYLWHYPIFSFLRMTYGFDYLPTKVLAIILSVFFSYISYKFIETPFRRRVSGHVFYISMSVVFISLVGTSFTVVSLNGLPYRFSGTIANGAEEMKEYLNKYWGSTSQYTNSSDFKEDRFSIEVIGSSWGQDIANAIVENSDYQVSFKGMTGHMCKAITLGGWIPKDKQKSTEDIIARCKNNKQRFKISLDNADLVILADHRTLQKVGDKEVLDETMRNIGLLREHGYNGPVMIIANRPVYSKNIFEIIAEFGSSGNAVNLYAEKYNRLPLSKYLDEDKEAEKTYNTLGVDYYSIVESLCQNGRCKIAIDGKPLYHDATHLTMSGAQYVGKDLVEKINTLYEH